MFCGSKNLRRAITWGACILAGGCGEPQRQIEVSGELVRGLQSDLADERLDAAVAIGEMPRVSDEVAAALLQVLEDEDAEVRLAAAKALASLGDNGHFYIDTLQQTYETERDPDVRRAYEESFAAIAAAEHDAIK